MGFFTNDSGGAGGGVSDHGALTGLGGDDHTQYALISSGTGAPGTTPTRVGEVYIGTAADTIYHSTGTASSADWTLVSVDGHTHAAADTVSGTFADARIAESNVTQHEAALSITESQISDLGSYITASSMNTLTNKSGNISQWTNDSLYITATSSNTLTNKTFDANGTGNSISNIEVEDLADGTDGELITWSTLGVATTIAAGADGHVLTSKGAGAVPVFEAAAGGGGDTIFDYAPGNFINTSQDFYYTGIPASFTGTKSLLAGFLYLKLGMFAAATYTRIGINMTSGGGAGTVARLGIYEVNSSGSPGLEVLDAGTVDTSTTGLKEITISETLTAGRYFLACWVEATTSVTAHSVYGGDPLAGLEAVNSIILPVVRRAYSGVDTGGLPAIGASDSFVAETSVSAFPGIFLRVV